MSASRPSAGITSSPAVGARPVGHVDGRVHLDRPLEIVEPRHVDRLDARARMLLRPRLAVALGPLRRRLIVRAPLVRHLAGDGDVLVDARRAARRRA